MQGTDEGRVSGMRLLLDAAVVAGTAWLAGRALAGRARGIIEHLLGWGILSVALVAGSGVVLGALGRLGWGGFVWAHGTALIGCMALRRRHLAADRRELRTLFAAVLATVRKERALVSFAAALGIFLVVTGVMAALAQPVVYDALSYRLSRIGHWLQEGRVGHFPTNDPRQNYMPIVPDLVVAWLVSAFPAEFRGAALANWSGGVLLLIATAGLARLAGLGRSAALGAALLAAGTANVALQFTTAHTDLFTAGLLAAAFYLWQSAARRGEGSWLAGIGGGLALGAKGTVFYLGPTLLLWAVWTGWQLRLPVAAWVRTMLATMGAVAVFALPGILRNEQTYGGPFGPADFVSMHHQAAGGRLLRKTGLNLGASMVQVMEPNSQFPGLQPAARALGTWLAGGLPQQDPFSYEGLNRRETLQAIIQRTEPDADATSFGLLALVLFLTGAAGALCANRPGAGEIRRWSAGVMMFLVFFHAMQQWHPYGFRYFVLVAPWMAVSAAWWLEGLPQRLRRLVWAVALFASAATAGRVLTHTHQAGWRALTQPERARNYHVYREWRAWISALDQAGEPLQLALPFNRPLAAFYRLQPATPVRPQTASTLAGLTAEQALAKFGGGWLIVPALQFMGREGQIGGRIWLFEGDPASPFSVAAYHELPPAVGAEPLVYRNQIRREADRTSYDLLVRAGGDGRVTLCLESALGGPWGVTISTPTEVQRAEWGGGKSRRLLVLPANQVAEIIITIEFAPEMTPPTAPPLVEVVR